MSPQDGAYVIIVFLTLPLFFCLFVTLLFSLVYSEAEWGFDLSGMGWIVNCLLRAPLELKNKI